MLRLKSLSLAIALLITFSIAPHAYADDVVQDPTKTESPSPPAARNAANTFVATHGMKGLAMAVRNTDDLKKLNVSWWYTWGWCDEPGCVPMSYNMQKPPSCPHTLLVGNEPNAAATNGGPVTPTDAASRVIAIENTCPNTLLVVGNVAYDDWSRAGGWGDGYNWLAQFLHTYRALRGREYAQAIGVHCYSQHLASYCLEGLSKLRQLYHGEMWVTEFGIFSGDAEQFSILQNHVAANFTRYAAYTNRQPHTHQSWEVSTGVELVNGDGTLTTIGVVYASR